MRISSSSEKKSEATLHLRYSKLKEIRINACIIGTDGNFLQSFIFSCSQFFVSW